MALGTLVQMTTHIIYLKGIVCYKPNINTAIDILCVCFCFITKLQHYVVALLWCWTPTSDTSHRKAVTGREEDHIRTFLKCIFQHYVERGVYYTAKMYFCKSLLPIDPLWLVLCMLALSEWQSIMHNKVHNIAK